MTLLLDNGISIIIFPTLCMLRMLSYEFPNCLQIWAPQARVCNTFDKSNRSPMITPKVLHMTLELCAWNHIVMYLHSEEQLYWDDTLLSQSIHKLSWKGTVCCPSRRSRLTLEIYVLLTMLTYRERRQYTNLLVGGVLTSFHIAVQASWKTSLRVEFLAPPKVL